MVFVNFLLAHIHSTLSRFFSRNFFNSIILRKKIYPFEDPFSPKELIVKHLSDINILSYDDKVNIIVRRT